MFAQIMLSALFASEVDVPAAELSKIDRSLPDPLVWHSATPKYCLLVFGPEAKTRVWLVHDNQTMHFRHLGPGASGAWRQAHNKGGYYHLGDVVEAGGVKHTGLRIGPYHDEGIVAVSLAGRSVQAAGLDRYGKLSFAARAEDAPIVHFNGPITMDLFHIQRPLRSDATVRLSVVTGTPGLGGGTFAYFCCDSFPVDAWPTAEIHYPAKATGPAPPVELISLGRD